MKNIVLLFAIVFLNVFEANCQNQKLADSLISIYTLGNYMEDERNELLKAITKNETNHNVRLKYAELLFKQAIKDSSFNDLQYAYTIKGDVLQLKGDYVGALEQYLLGMNYIKRLNDKRIEGAANISIANTYSMMGNSNNAHIYYSLGIDLLRKTSDSISLAKALLNAGDEYFNTKDFEQALKHFNESEFLFQKLDYSTGTAYNLGNKGMVYAEQGNHELAEKNINEAIAILEDLEDYYPISVYLTYMADIYLEQDDLNTAFNYANRSLDLAIQYELKDQISEANLKLSELHELAGNKDSALEHYKSHITYRDSIRNLETIQKMADQRTDYEISQKQIEVDLLNQKRKNQKIVLIATIITLFLIGLLAYGLFKRNKFIKATSKIIEAEKERSDNLLLNILPEETASELKVSGAVTPQKHKSVSVLFTDFVGFTKFSKDLTPEELVKTVDFYFSKFDEIIESYKLEKIKTIGDAYMCAGGLHSPTEDHAKRMILAAFDIAKFVEKVNIEDAEPDISFNVRIGIHTGPVVAGVVGSKKFAYDIWGDTVNIASRMESNSEVGKINISEATYNLVKDNFKCEYRGEIDAKNRGMLKMYFVNSMKTKSNSNKILEHVTTRS